MNTLTAKQLKEMLDRKEDFLLINTLDEKDFAKTRIPGSINIPQSKENFVQRVEEEAGQKDRTIVVYCASEQCESSPKGAKKLEDAGFSNVFDFEAGAEGWRQAGQGLVVG